MIEALLVATVTVCFAVGYWFGRRGIITRIATDEVQRTLRAAMSDVTDSKVALLIHARGADVLTSYTVQGETFTTTSKLSEESCDRFARVWAEQEVERLRSVV
jgi:hypothetical protein